MSELRFRPPAASRDPNRIRVRVVRYFETEASLDRRAYGQAKDAGPEALREFLARSVRVGRVRTVVVEQDSTTFEVPGGAR